MPKLEVEEERAGRPSVGYVGISTTANEVVLEFPGATNGAVGLSPSEALRMAVSLLQAIEKLATQRAIETHGGEQ